MKNSLVHTAGWNAVVHFRTKWQSRQREGEPDNTADSFFSYWHITRINIFSILFVDKKKKEVDLYLCALFAMFISSCSIISDSMRRTSQMSDEGN